MYFNIGPKRDENFRDPARLKRLVDSGLALVALPIALPVMLAIALVIRLTSKGPAILRLTCVGQNGRLFRQYRFRVVRTDGGDNGLVRHLFAGRSNGTGSNGADHRLTGPGAWLLRTGLNRLPQLLNVIKGEMSLIGPAAIPAARINHDNQPDGRILAVRPGLISPDLFFPTERRMEEGDRLALSLAYADKASPRVDGRIFLQSASRAFRGSDR